jgi:hypothetical protein
MGLEVRTVNAECVYASLNKALQHMLGARCRTNSGDDFCASHAGTNDTTYRVVFTDTV